MLETEAPPELARIAAFVNTNELDGDSVNDGIRTPAALKTWLVDQGLLPKSSRVTAEDVEKAVGLRESLRSVLRDGDTAGLGKLNRDLRSLPLHVQFNTDGWPEVAPVASGVDGALTRLVAGIATAVAAGTWSRLKVCASDTCQWAFYDHSRNRSARWCSMRVCGNRSKIRTYRSGGATH